MIDPLKVGTFFFLILLGGVLFSFTTANLSKIPTPVNATLTGFPTWRFYIKDLDIQTWDSMIVFSSILPIVSGVFMLIWSSKYETLNAFIMNNEKTSSTTLFNKLLAGYAIATGVTNLLKWPYAAFWFKFQGLSLDIAVLIQFIRIYLKTQRDYQEALFHVLGNWVNSVFLLEALA
ncbi:6309_t:CDS:2, partial [Gigaspora rosea]